MSSSFLAQSNIVPLILTQFIMLRRRTEDVEFGTLSLTCGNVVTTGPVGTIGLVSGVMVLVTLVAGVSLLHDTHDVVRDRGRIITSPFSNSFWGLQRYLQRQWQGHCSGLQLGAAGSFSELPEGLQKITSTG